MATRWRWPFATKDEGQIQYQQLHSDIHHPQHQQPQYERTRQATLGCDEVAYIFREPFLLTGYRVPYKDWWYYITSMFQIHNETFNIWTHGIAFFVFMYKVCNYTQTFVGLWCLLYAVDHGPHTYAAQCKRAKTGVNI